MKQQEDNKALDQQDTDNSNRIEIEADRKDILKKVKNVLNKE